MNKRHFILADANIKARACLAVQDAPYGYHCIIQEPTRTLDQNAAQWPILEAFSRQLQWPVNGAMTTLTPEEWKDILTAAFRNETVRVAQGLNGGMVLLGCRTREFSKKEFSEWIDWLHSVAVERGIKLEPQCQS